MGNRISAITYFLYIFTKICENGNKYLKNIEREFVENIHELNEKNNTINTNYNKDIFYNKSNKTTVKCQELVVEKKTQNVLQKLRNFIGKLFIKNK